MLFLSDKNSYRATVQGPVLADLVFQEPSVRFFDILWQIGIEHERGDLRIRQLGTVFDLDIFSFDRLWWRCLDNRQHHLVQLGRAIGPNLDGQLVVVNGLANTGALDVVVHLEHRGVNAVNGKGVDIVLLDDSLFVALCGHIAAALVEGDRKYQ